MNLYTKRGKYSLKKKKMRNCIQNINYKYLYSLMKSVVWWLKKKKNRPIIYRR